MSEGRVYTVRVYVPEDPLDAQDGVEITLTGPTGQRTRLYVDATKTRAQLVTQALTDLRTYILAQS